jgi:hypothetical protein
LAEHATTREKAPDDATDSLWAVRAAMLSGLDIVAYHMPCTGVVEAVHHAAALAGRLSEVRYVHMSRPYEMQRIVPGSLGFDLDEGTGEARKPSDSSLLWFLPVFDPRAPREGGMVVVLMGSSTDQDQRTFKHVVEAVRRDALAQGRRMPLVVSPTWATMDPLEWMAMRLNRKHSGMRAYLCRSERPPVMDKEAWFVSDADRRSRIVPSFAGACCYLREGTRLVVAYGLAADGKPADATLAFEVGRDGWTYGLIFREFGQDPQMHEAIVRAIWDAGPAFSSRDGITVDPGGGPVTGVSISQFFEIGISLEDRLAIGLAASHSHLNPRGRRGSLALAAGPSDSRSAGTRDSLALVAEHADLRSATAVSQCSDGQSILLVAEGHPLRHDFVRTWGVLSSALLEPWAVKAVDGGARTLPLMAAWLGVTPPVARRMQGRLRRARYLSHYIQDDLETRHRLQAVGTLGWPAPADGNGFARACPGSDAALLGEIGHDNLPPLGDDGEWEALCDCAEMFESLSPPWFSEGDAPRIVAALLLRLPARDWTGRRSLIHAKGRAAIFDIGDYFTGVATWIRGLMGRGLPNEDVSRLVVGERSLAQLRDASIAWHENPALHGSGKANGASWPVPFDEIELGDGWTARCLPSHAELIAEGSVGEDIDGMSGLAHCVGGYHRLCENGTSLIVSLRQVRGGSKARVSTAELRRDPAGEWRFHGHEPRFELRQHRGARNRAPSTEASQMLLRLRIRLGSGSVPIDPAAFEERVAVMPTVSTRWAEEVLPAFAQVLPKPWRGLDADAFRARLDEVFGHPAPDHDQGNDRP